MSISVKEHPTNIVCSKFNELFGMYVKIKITFEDLAEQGQSIVEAIPAQKYEPFYFLIRLNRNESYIVLVNTLIYELARIATDYTDKLGFDEILLIFHNSLGEVK